MCPQLAAKLAALEQEVLVAGAGREETSERTELVARLQQEKDKRQKMTSRLKDFAENDPAVLEQLVAETGQAVEAANRWTDLPYVTLASTDDVIRWTDNIFSIQEWVKKKFPSVDQVNTHSYVGNLHFN